MYVPEEGGVILTRDVAPFWLGFPDFDADRTAPFEDQFASLAKQEGWGAKKRRKQLVRAISSEVAFRMDDHGRAEQWKSLCVEVGITGELKSITQCKKVWTVSVEFRKVQCIWFNTS